jgi:lipid II:glycine glycyltransferase (peptidoglycan interpeptide bridge formation enzyme)
MLLPDSSWDGFVRAHPHGHILQTSAWGRLKSAFGWRAEPVRVGDSGALVLFRPLPLGWTLAYVPRGPLADWNRPAALGELVAALDRLCRAHRAICLKWEPDLPDSPACADALTALGFRPSPQAVQPRRTLVVDLGGAEAEILARMKQKTRYNIGLAAKKNITIRAAQSTADVEAFVALMRVTGARDRFGVHADDYYRAAHSLFNPSGCVELFLAEYRGEPLAGVMAFALGKRAWYFYGASSDRERNRMAPYLAQWAAVRWARERGALTYDLWGVPDENEDVLEAEFETRRDGLWGVYRFKRGWGGKLVRTVGAWDRVYNPALYQAYVAYLRMREQTPG